MRQRPKVLTSFKFNPSQDDIQLRVHCAVMFSNCCDVPFVGWRCKCYLHLEGTKGVGKFTLTTMLLRCDVVDTWFTACISSAWHLIWGRPISRANTVKVEKALFPFLFPFPTSESRGRSSCVLSVTFHPRWRGRKFVDCVQVENNVQ